MSGTFDSITSIFFAFEVTDVEKLLQILTHSFSDSQYILIGQFLRSIDCDLATIVVCSLILSDHWGCGSFRLRVDSLGLALELGGISVESLLLVVLVESGEFRGLRVIRILCKSVGLEGVMGGGIETLPPYILQDILYNGQLAPEDLASLEASSYMFRAASGIAPYRFKSITELAAHHACQTHPLFENYPPRARSDLLARCEGNWKLVLHFLESLQQRHHVSTHTHTPLCNLILLLRGFV